MSVYVYISRLGGGTKAEVQVGVFVTPVLFMGEGARGRG